MQFHSQGSVCNQLLKNRCQLLTFTLELSTFAYNRLCSVNNQAKINNFYISPNQYLIHMPINIQRLSSNIIKGCGNDTVVVKNYDEMYMLSVSSGEKITTIATDNWERQFALNADGNLVITREQDGHCIYDLSYSNGKPKYTIGDMSIGFTFFRPGYEMYFVGNNSICFPENINGVNYLFVKDFTGREYSLEERIANTHFNLDAVRTYLNKK